MVKIHENKLGNRKYNKGHRVEGVLVIVCVEKTPDKRFFCKELSNKKEKITKNILSIYLRRG